jgi:hypothetical protein
MRGKSCGTERRSHRIRDSHRADRLNVEANSPRSSSPMFCACADPDSCPDPKSASAVVKGKQVQEENWDSRQSARPIAKLGRRKVIAKQAQERQHSRHCRRDVGEGKPSPSIDRLPTVAPRWPRGVLPRAAGEAAGAAHGLRREVEAWAPQLGLKPHLY